MKQYLKKRLNSFDIELGIMVESLTGKPCELKNGGDHYFFEADYSDHAGDPDFIGAMWDAIVGRTGERLIRIKDNPTRKSLIVFVKYSDRKFPGIMRQERGEQNPSYGQIYCKRIAEIRAIQVKRENAQRLIDFVGNGEMETPESGPCIFHFRNVAGGVFAHAPEDSYIIYRGPERFEIMDRQTFEKEYEKK